MRDITLRRLALFLLTVGPLLVGLYVYLGYPWIAAAFYAATVVVAVCEYKEAV